MFRRRQSKKIELREAHVFKLLAAVSALLMLAYNTAPATWRVQVFELFKSALTVIQSVLTAPTFVLGWIKTKIYSITSTVQDLISQITDWSIVADLRKLWRAIERQLHMFTSSSIEQMFPSLYTATNSKEGDESLTAAKAEQIRLGLTIIENNPDAMTTLTNATQAADTANGLQILKGLQRNLRRRFHPDKGGTNDDFVNVKKAMEAIVHSYTLENADPAIQHAYYESANFNRGQITFDSSIMRHADHQFI